MKNYLINITWGCQLQCSYCWVRKSIYPNLKLLYVKHRTFEEWTRAIENDPPDFMTLGGGEPLLVPWALDLIRAFPGIKWCLSTNGVEKDKIVELAIHKLPQVHNVNLSYHPEAARLDPQYVEQWKHEITILAGAGYNVSSNIEKVNNNVEDSQEIIDWMALQNLPMLISPICGGREELAHPQDTPLVCEGGVNHLVIAPNGDAWPCQTTINSYAWRETCLGNWIDGTLDLSKKPQPCNLRCVEYFYQYPEHQAGDFFFLNVREQ
jgi:organic radical activating enzyme